MTRVRLGVTNAAIFSGKEDLSVWDDEELRRGYRRDKNGGWSGRKPKVVPMELYKELSQRQYDKAAELLRDSLVDAVSLFRELVLDPKVDPGIRLKAAQTIADRVLGRAPLTVDLQVEAPWMKIMADNIINIPDPKDDLAGVLDVNSEEVARA